MRKVRLLLHREGGTIGDLLVSYDAVYSWNGTLIRGKSSHGDVVHCSCIMQHHLL